MRRNLDKKWVSRKGTAPIDEVGSAPNTAPEVVKAAKARLKGKSLLFIGGSKGQGQRKKEYLTTFELGEFEWPDLEVHSKPESVLPKIERADVVAYLIRFSRHSYKSLVNEARSQGKEVVVMKAGLNLVKFATAYCEQVLRLEQSC
ncbi:MAG: hypothetical protein KF733_03555 [Fimbriimonadaceae bacterium]|nr:MAG: hypothetical protein KF733_03555 [Fimbriimonadaceae bacterium]